MSSVETQEMTSVGTQEVASVGTQEMSSVETDKKHFIIFGSTWVLVAPFCMRIGPERSVRAPGTLSDHPGPPKGLFGSQMTD